MFINYLFNLSEAEQSQETASCVPIHLRMGDIYKKHATYNEVKLVAANSDNNYTKGFIGISVYQEN